VSVMNGDERPDGARWKTWDADAWSQVLFRHFFGVTGGNSRPVSRLSLSGDELAAATLIPGVGPRAARAAFIEAVRCPPREFRKRLSREAVGPGAWPRDRVPPFLAHLLFTVFVAGSFERGIASEGDFRERLRTLLGHPVGTSYALSDLSRLWKTFASWLDDQRKQGALLRSLALPYPGHMTLIGYSVRLAFPQKSDRHQLVRALTEAQLGAEPPVAEVMQQLGRRMDQRFSVSFREVFAKARAALAKGVASAELEALWSTVLDAASVAVAEPARGTRFNRYQLFLQEDDLLQVEPFLVASRNTGTSAALRFDPLEEPLRDYPFLLRAGAEGSTLRVSQQVLLGSFAREAPDFRRSLVPRLVEQGVLLFMRNDDGTRELTASRPAEGRVWALVRRDLSTSFLDLLAPARPQSRPAKFDNWFDIGPFDAASLHEVSTGGRHPLANIRCLQQTSVGPHIALSEGIRVDGGFLGTPSGLPVARCQDADAMTLFAVPTSGTDTGAALPASVLSRRIESEVFEFVEADRREREGRFNLVAMRRGQPIASREIAFHSRVVASEYETPTDPQAWMIEAAGPDVLSARDGRDVFLKTDPTSAQDAIELSRRTVALRSRLNNGEEFDPLVRSIDDDTRLDQCTEAIAAISVRRKGISESELLELFAQILQIPQGPGIWDVVRSWIESGYIDALLPRRWRGRIYFARRPRLVMVVGEPDPTVVLHGLAPYYLRSRARAVFEEVGGKEAKAESVSPLVGGPISWIVESVGAAEEAALKLGIGSLEFSRPPLAIGQPIAQLLTSSSQALPGYQREGEWDWERGGFRAPRSKEDAPVRIEWRSRIDRPDLFVVEQGGGVSWFTYSRNWALLIGYLWSERSPFESLGRRSLRRVNSFGPYIPLPVARAIVLASRVASGPVDLADREATYAYCVSAAADKGRVLRWLSARREVGDAQRRLRWLLSVLGESNVAEDTFPVPARLRRRLRELSDLPEAAILSGKRIPRRWLPHLQRAVELAGV
jgi:hypothetical protein